MPAPRVEPGLGSRRRASAAHAPQLSGASLRHRHAGADRALSAAVPGAHRALSRTWGAGWVLVSLWGVSARGPCRMVLWVSGLCEGPCGSKLAVREAPRAGGAPHSGPPAVRCLEEPTSSLLFN